MNAPAKTNLMDAILEKVSNQLGKLIDTSDDAGKEKFDNALNTFKERFNELNNAYPLSNPAISLSGLEQTAAESAGKAAVQSLAREAKVKVKEYVKNADAENLGNEMAQAAAKVVIGKSIKNKTLTEKANALEKFDEVFKINDPIKTGFLLNDGANAKAHAVNSFERYGVALGAAFLAYNRVRAAFKPKTIVNEQGEQEKVSKPWYSKVGNLLLAAGFTVLAVKVGYQGHSTKQALTDMTKPVLGKWTAQMGAKSSENFAGFTLGT